MFNFRIIDTADGNQIIDRNLKTPYSALTPVQLLEYTEIDAQLTCMDKLERKARKTLENKDRAKRNLLCRVACVARII